MRTTLILLSGLLLTPAAALGAPEFTVPVAVQVGLTFTDEEIRILRDHYRPSDKARGSRKHKNLPPGIAKNLARGKSLPPGITRQLLPYAVRRELPPAPDGFERIIVGGKILLVEVATQVIHDILADVILD